MKVGTTSGNLLIALLLGLAGAMGGAALESPVTPPRSDSYGQVLNTSALAPTGGAVDPGTIQPLRLPISPATPAPPDVAAKAHVQAALGKLPLYFIENRGQLDERVGYYLQGRDNTVYFTADGVTFALTSPAAEAAKPPRHPASVRPVALESEPESAGARERWALKLEFQGANPNVNPVGQSPTPAVVSYFKGPREAWKTGLPTYASVVYPDLWPGIDLVYSGTAGRLKYTFLVKPGADPQQIKLAYRGATVVRLTEAGELAISTPVGGFRDEKPVSHQEVNGQRVEVATAYALDAEVVSGEHPYGFRLGAYDASKPLVLDPVVIVYAGYIGGAGDDVGYGIAVDGAGNAYVTGYTGSTDFPVLVGPDLTWNGSYDAFVAKVKADGTGLVYAGYIGGAGDDVGQGIAVDGAGNAYVTGRIASTETTFPVTVGPDLTYNGGYYDAFVAKVKADGTGLVYAGYIGGAGDDRGYGIAVDGAGNAYVTGWTYSTEATFPVTVGPDLTFNGAVDAFVAKVRADGTGLVYAGYIGGAGGTLGYGIAVDGAGNAYVTGWTNSTEATFPVAVGPDLTYNGGTYNGSFSDAFVAKVRADGTGLVYAGYIGGAGDDVGYGIAVDGAGNAYVTGYTGSTEATFPVLVGPDLTYNGGFADAFVAKVRADGTGLVYAGYIGGANSEIGYGIAVDGAGNAYVTGWTSSTEATFPVLVGPDLTFNGSRNSVDAFVAKVGAPGFLTFPLHNKTPFDAKFASVFDHSMNQQYCPDEVVTAYTGEQGSRNFGRDVVMSFLCQSDGMRHRLFGFRQDKAGTPFSVGGQYVGEMTGRRFLYYDGHPGYDYRTKDQNIDGTLCSPDGQICSDGVTEVISAAAGTVTCASMGGKMGCPENKKGGTVRIDHGNGYSTVYLHFSNIYVASGQTVGQGKPLGLSGDTGLCGSKGSPCGLQHLHFEVRFNANNAPVDPYGWRGAGPDPYTRATNQNLWK